MENDLYQLIMLTVIYKAAHGLPVGFIIFYHTAQKSIAATVFMFMLFMPTPWKNIHGKKFEPAKNTGFEKRYVKVLEKANLLVGFFIFSIGMCINQHKVRNKTDVVGFRNWMKRFVLMNTTDGSIRTAARSAYRTVCCGTSSVRRGFSPPRTWPNSSLRDFWLWAAGVRAACAPSASRAGRFFSQLRRACGFSSSGIRCGTCRRSGRHRSMSQLQA